MDTLNFSHLGHSYLKYANPIDEGKIEKVIEICAQKSLNQALDIGSGNFYLLKKFVQQACHSGTGLELPEKPENQLIDLPENIKAVFEDANTFLPKISDSTIDLGICIGSCHALGGYEDTLRNFSRIVRKGGLVVMGDGYWKQKPSSHYLKFLEGTEDELKTHFGNLDAANKYGLTPLWSTTANDDEWDTYEWNYAMAIEDYFFKNPNHPQKEEFLKKISNWRRGVWEWGRDTLGFGLYVFRKT